MMISFLQQPRLSYAQAVLPIFRTMFVGGVLAILALLAGFVAPAPSSLARPAAPARGPLIEAGQHPEWKQFLVQAAYQRADEVARLRDLPDSAALKPPNETPSPAIPVQVADLPPPHIEVAPEDVTGSIDDTSAGVMPMEIGETSATELPISDQDLQTPIQQPETLKRNESQRKAVAPARRQAKVRKPPAPAKPEPDFFTSLFGGSADRAAGVTQAR
jgi:hypothetical protein